MDAAILHERLAAAEGALITIDERLDALTNDEQGEIHSDAILSLDNRLSACEETLQSCLEHLSALQTQIASTEQTIAEAEVAVAEAEKTEAIAEALEAVAEASENTSQDLMLSEEIAEVEPEPESEGEAVPANSKSPNWLERFLVLQ
jgi:chromosome segregation ATPase